MVRALVFCAVLALGFCALAAMGQGFEKEDLAGFPGGLGQGVGFDDSYVPTGWDTVTVLYTLHDGLTHNLDDYNDFEALSTTRVVQLDTTNFRYAYPLYASTGAGEADFFSYGSNHQAFQTFPTRDASFDLASGPAAATTCSYLIYHYPFEDDIPSGSEVLEAELVMLVNSNAYVASQDSVSVTLLDEPADSAWIDANRHFIEETTVGEYQMYSQTSNYYQKQSRDVSLWPWHLTNSFPEVTLVDSDAWSGAPRDTIFKWGDVTDLSGSPGVASNGFIPQYTELNINIRQCVQAVADRHPNNGMIFAFHSSADPEDPVSWIGFEVRTSSSAFYPYQPYMKVTYVTKAKRSYFPGGSDLAFVFSTDDANDINREWIDAFRDHDATYTIYAKGGNIVGGDTAGADSLKAWRDLGFPIGYHSFLHTAVTGISRYDTGPAHAVFDTVEYSRGMHPLTLTNTAAATGWDSLLWDADPDALYEAMEDRFPGYDFRGDSKFCKTFALPVSTYPTGPVNLALDLFGYRAWRHSGQFPDYAADNNWNRDFSRPTDLTISLTSAADSARVHWRLAAPKTPWNMRCLTTNGDISSLVGLDGSNPTEADVKAAVRHQVWMARARGSVSLQYFGHAAKGSAYTSGEIDTDELTWILEELDRLGVWITNYEDYQTRIEAITNVSATPATWRVGGGGNIPDDYSFEEADDVWRVWSGASFK